MPGCEYINRDHKGTWHCVPPDGNIRPFPNGITAENCINPFGNRCGAYCGHLQGRIDQLSYELRDLKDKVADDERTSIMGKSRIAKASKR